MKVMKRLFTFSAFLVLIVLPNILIAQNCDFAQTGVRYNTSYTDPVTGNCIINVDLYYDLRTNAGSKYVTMHIWPKAIYPALPYNHPPDSIELAGSTTVVIHHFQDHANSHVDTVYKPDPRVVTQYIDMSLIIGPSTFGDQYERYTITNLNLEISGSCGIPQAFTMDVWSTESESMNSVQCLNTGKDFFANNPKINGLFVCSIPRMYNVQISSIDPAVMIVGLDVYIDNGDNVFNKTEDTLNIKSVTGLSISNNISYQSVFFSYPPYDGTSPYANMNLWVEVSSASLPNSVIYAIENTCFALPIELMAFTAAKSGKVVLLKWTTSSESGNKGFYIEKSLNNQGWQTIDFIPSKAKNGNSTAELSYDYTDNIISKGIIQYRLKQTDLDGKFSYSAVRVLDFDDSGLLKVFPNPSRGSFTIFLPDLDAAYFVHVFDMNGKKIINRQNCNSILRIDGLRPGVYLLTAGNKNDKNRQSVKILVQ
jgi:hypothetical protein